MSYVHNGRHWVDRHGNIADFNPPKVEHFEFRGNRIHAAIPLTHAGRRFRAGAELGRIERDRNGTPTLTEWDGRVSKLRALQ